jgi:hypothetical protein
VLLVAEALPGLNLDRLDLETRSLGEDGINAPWALGTLDHAAILPKIQQDAYAHSSRPPGSADDAARQPSVVPPAQVGIRGGRAVPLRRTLRFR